jgi:hypothetical protein
MKALASARSNEFRKIVTSVVQSNFLPFSYDFPSKDSNPARLDLSFGVRKTSVVQVPRKVFPTGAIDYPSGIELKKELRISLVGP